MRYALLADIHANLEAFNAVLDDIVGKGGVDEYWCLGDIVGYGADPAACIKKLKSLKGVVVAGNHDLAAIDRASMAELNPDAAIACRWTKTQLSIEDIAFLEALSQVAIKNNFTLVHGSPRNPAWEYLISASLATQNFAFLDTPYCLVGHTHVPMVYREEDDGTALGSRLQPGIRLLLGGTRLIINPGSVGQPRNGDTRASYAIYDTDTSRVHPHRVEYDIYATQRKILDAGLPIRLATRLVRGA
ncbi:metallophosphoesterase family protein [Chloroflexota bacterium]